MTLSLKPLSDQVIVITGASSGIGLVTARIAAARGAKVVLIARNQSALSEIVGEIRAKGGTAELAVADVGDRKALSAAADIAVEKFGRIDTWVNNAGVAIYADLLDTPDNEHERLFRTNYFGVVFGSTIAVEHLCDKGGALVNVVSIAADMPSPIMGAYAASKHASRAFSESLRIELRSAKLPISLSIIKPSGISTPIGRHSANHLDGEAKIPPPAYDPKLVAEAILDCAVHPRRDVTIGGVGRAQVLFAEHFPALFERLATLLPPLLFTRKAAKTNTDNLQQPQQDGEERSPLDPPLRHSIYTSAKLHPRRTMGLFLLAAVAGGTVMRARRSAKDAKG